MDCDWSLWQTGRLNLESLWSQVCAGLAAFMSEEQIREIVTAVLAELEIEKPAPSDKGKIMKVLMPKVKGKADGKAVNEILASMMK